MPPSRHRTVMPIIYIAIYMAISPNRPLSFFHVSHLLTSLLDGGYFPHTDLLIHLQGCTNAVCFLIWASEINFGEKVTQ